MRWKEAPDRRRRGGATELREHLLEVAFDRVGADEQLSSNLRIRQAGAGQSGDLSFLRRYARHPTYCTQETHVSEETI